MSARVVGYRAIAAACCVTTATVRGWRRKALRGLASPVTLHETITGRVWTTEADVDAYFCPPTKNAVRESARARVAIVLAATGGA